MITPSQGCDAFTYKLDRNRTETSGNKPSNNQINMKTKNILYYYILFATIVMTVYGKLVIFAFVAYY